MALKTEKISQLEVLESAEGTRVLVEQDGKYKRVDAEKIGGGKDGKSAYQYAQDGGYTGTEEEFSEKLAFDPYIEGAGEVLLSHTATFATDAAAKNGVLVPGTSVTAILDTVYWLEINGELRKCHWERSFVNTDLYDENGNSWVTKTLNGDYVGAPTAGTYTYKLYAPAEEPMLDPQYLPPNIALKSDIPAGVVKSVNGTEPDADGNVEIEVSGGSGVDVTASVGQTIVVTEVDANGKPTKWEAADYQPRTHGTDWHEIVPLTEFTPGYNDTLNAPAAYLNDFELVAGEEYKVVFDGVEYICEAMSGVLGSFAFIAIGNKQLVGGADTGEPFGVVKVTGGEGGMVITFDMNPHSVQVFGGVVVPIPVEYVTNAFPYYIDVVEETLVDETTGNQSTTFTTSETVANLTAVLETGRDVIVRCDEPLSTVEGTRQTVFYRLLGFYRNGSGLIAFNGAMGEQMAFVPQDDGTYFVRKVG